MDFVKYHGLGNDYLVIAPTDTKRELTSADIARICHRHYGVGSDGILYGPLVRTPEDRCDFAVKIFNPDGTEAEKSGNGLRIFSRFLWDEGLVGEEQFSVETLGGHVRCQVGPGGRTVTVEMGQVSFDSGKIPVEGPPREVLREEIQVGDQVFTYSAATVGNPHCVVFSEDPTEHEAKEYGPALEIEPRFTNRTNVQFLKVVDRRRLRIEIWERGAGYTLASGSSSTAAAAVARRLGLCEAEVVVAMPGGELEIRLTDDFHATMSGPVTRVCHGEMSQEMFVPDTADTSGVILVPPDIEGSWLAMLAIYDRLERGGRLFDWSSEEGYHRHRSRKSLPMARLLRELSDTPLRDQCRVGGSLFGVVIANPQVSPQRIVSLNVTPERKIEIRLLDVAEQSVRPPVLDQVISDLTEARSCIECMVKQL